MEEGEANRGSPASSWKVIYSQLIHGVWFDVLAGHLFPESNNLVHPPKYFACVCTEPSRGSVSCVVCGVISLRKCGAESLDQGSIPVRLLTIRSYGAWGRGVPTLYGVM